MRAQHKLFVAHYGAGGLKNATKAALDAGYSERTARSQASRLLSKVDIQEEIERQTQAALGDVEQATLRLLKRLDTIIDADVGDFANVEYVMVREAYTDDEGVEHPAVYKKQVHFNETKDLDTTVLSEIGETQHGIKIKLHDPLRAAELKGKYLGMWGDNGVGSHQKETKREKLEREKRQARILELQRKLGKK